MIKRSFGIQMSYEMTSSEKIQAEKALMHFSEAAKLLLIASNHLNIMKTPFKENMQMESEDLMNVRAYLRRFRDKSVENFNDFKKESFNCIKLMQIFTSDSQTIKLLKSFISSIEELEINVNNFIELFNNLEDKDFAKNAVNGIEMIQNQSDDIKDIINDRIKNHIQSNILAANWVSSLSDELHMKVEKKTPLIVELFNKRQDQLNEILKNRQ